MSEVQRSTAPLKHPLTAVTDGRNGNPVLWLEQVQRQDVPQVGGKAASLGEMIQNLSALGVQVPGGFAVTAGAFRDYLRATGLQDWLEAVLARMRDGKLTPREAATQIRDMIEATPLPDGLAGHVRLAYRALSARHAGEAGVGGGTDVAVRSSATAEDLPDASFAGQHDTFPQRAGEAALLQAVQGCYAALFTERALAYREEHGFAHLDVALAVVVQKMVRADVAAGNGKAGGAAGVMFSLDPESGFPQVVVINGNWGLGETVVQGSVTPDEFMVFKPLLDNAALRPIIKRERGEKSHKMVYGTEGKATRTVPTTPEERDALVLGDDEALRLARWAKLIEQHYGCPMDMEWAKDGETGELFCVQARPETVHSRRTDNGLKTYTLESQGPKLLEGLALGEAIAAGAVCVLRDLDEADRFVDGAILVTDMTDPGWVPLMQRASGLITDAGGRTSHAAIVSRELGLPAIVGTGQATSLLKDGQEVTLSCAEGERGVVYEGLLPWREEALALDDLPEAKTQLMLNMADPGAALRWWRLPADGVGLARMEFIINNRIQVHPMALVHYDALEDGEDKAKIEELTRGYEDRSEYFVDNLARDVARIAASRYPHPVIVRLSDFKTNEYAHLLGGRQFEPVEENPMLGFRGAARYTSPRYREGFALECRAMKRVREEIGLDNVILMVPFCRTPKEGDRVLAELAANGLTRGENGLQVYVMAELPSNVMQADAFAERFDGFSIGSNDLTQLTLGLDRDSGSAELNELFDERDEAVQAMIRLLVRAARRRGRKVGICGQGPSDHPEFAAFLVEQGIDSLSLNPDSVLSVRQTVAEVERRLRAVS